MAYCASLHDARSHWKAVTSLFCCCHPTCLLLSSFPTSLPQTAPGQPDNVAYQDGFKRLTVAPWPSHVKCMLCMHGIPNSKSWSPHVLLRTLWFTVKYSIKERLLNESLMLYGVNVPYTGWCFKDLESGFVWYIILLSHHNTVQGARWKGF